MELPYYRWFAFSSKWAKWSSGSMGLVGLYLLRRPSSFAGLLKTQSLLVNLPLIFQNPPNIFWEGVWTPKRPNLREVFGGPNTYSQNIWKTSALQRRFHVERHNLSFARCSPSWCALPRFCRVKPGSKEHRSEIPRLNKSRDGSMGGDWYIYLHEWMIFRGKCMYTYCIHMNIYYDHKWIRREWNMNEHGYLHASGFWYPKFSKDCICFAALEHPKGVGKAFWIGSGL